MDSTTFSQISQAWNYIEDTSRSHEPAAMTSLRRNIPADAESLTILSSSQAELLSLQARILSARTVLLIGTHTGEEIPPLVSGMQEDGQITVLTSSREETDQIRSLFDTLPGSHAKMRCVNAQADEFLQRLNAHDYDMIVVSGDASNYSASLTYAHQLLRSQGMLVLTDAMALATKNSQGGVPNPADRDTKVIALREAIDSLYDDENFDTALLAVGTGVLLAVSR